MKKNIKKTKRNIITKGFLKRPEPRYLYWKRIIDSKKNPDRKKYFAFFLKKKNNVFITITNRKGQVVVSKSAGDCKITTKKKKKSWDTLKEVSAAASKVARVKNIKYIYKLFMLSSYVRNARVIHKSFRQLGLIVLQVVTLKRKPFSSLMRKKKSKRL